MKIALMGSHGVGKTTLCFDVAGRLKRLNLAVDVVKEVARTCPLPINRDTTLEAQSWILHTQIAQELAASPPSFDGTRDTSGTFQAAIDALIDELLDSLAIPHVRLDPNDRDGWVEVVIRTVGLPVQPPQIDFFG